MNELNVDGPAMGAFENRLPEPGEIANAKRLLELAVASRIADGGSLQFRVALDENAQQQTVVLAPALAASFLEMLENVSRGFGIRLIPIEPELTAQQASDILNVPRSYLGKLLEEGEISYEMKRGNRRIRADALFAYKRKRDRIRSEILTEMIQFDQEMGLL